MTPKGRIIREQSLQTIARLDDLLGAFKYDHYTRHRLKEAKKTISILLEFNQELAIQLDDLNM